MRVDLAIQQVQEAESELAKELRVVGERHAVEHDLYHLCHTLARQCEENLRRLAPFAVRYRASPEDASPRSPTALERIRHKSAELVGRSQASGLLLLRDLRTLYLTAQEAEIAWVMLAQVGRVARDRELLHLVTECHEQAQVRGKWLRTRIKESCPQVLGTG